MAVPLKKLLLWLLLERKKLGVKFISLEPDPAVYRGSDSDPVFLDGRIRAISGWSDPGYFWMNAFGSRPPGLF